jgi:3-hydroxybutyryl-CoA dehydrogenase
VLASDSPGFIVNHAGRGMNTEGLRIAAESVADFPQIDRIVREQLGFRLGPFELMDLTGLDVSQPVMEAIYHQYYEEPRFTPSPMARNRMLGGLFGKKNGEGFYRYLDGKPIVVSEAAGTACLPASIWISRANPTLADTLTRMLAGVDVVLESGGRPSDQALIVVLPLGLDATSAIIAEALDPGRSVAIDMITLRARPGMVTLMGNPAILPGTLDQAREMLTKAGMPSATIRDSTGFVAQRILATIVNIACDIAQQSVATPEDIDLAVQLGLGYPLGPLAMGDMVGALTIVAILTNMSRLLQDPRYRPSPWLLRRASLGLSLSQRE